MDRDVVNVFHQEKNMMKKKLKTFESLPNEMFRAILLKVAGKVLPKLLVYRGVCQQWQDMIESIFAEKRSIVIQGRLPISDISDRLNRLVDFGAQNCVQLTLKMRSFRFACHSSVYLCNDFCLFLVRLFPRVEHVALTACFELPESPLDQQSALITLLSHWSSTIVTLFMPDFISDYPASELPALIDQFDQLTALKRLDSFVSYAQLKPTTLARLEHCDFYYSTLEEKRQTVPLLGTNCTSLYQLDDLVDLSPDNNLPLVSGLKRLTLTARVEGLRFVCEHFASLQMLNIRVVNSDFVEKFIFNSNKIIARLARLSHLTDLSLVDVKLNLAPTRTRLASSLNSVKCLTLTNFLFDPPIRGPLDGDLFCSVLANVVPNLEQLTIKHRNEVTRAAIALHLGHFVHLRKSVLTAR